MSNITNKTALDNQFKQDKLEGTTLCTKFADWLSEQTEERLVSIQASATVDSVIDAIDTTVQAASVIIKQPTTLSKAAIAKQIFEEELATGTLVRKNILARFKSEANLTQAGANTYYNNLREKHNLVVHRTA